MQHPTWSTIGHGIERIPNEGSSFVQCCCVEPLRGTAQHIAHCVAQVIASAALSTRVHEVHDVQCQEQFKKEISSKGN